MAITIPGDKGKPGLPQFSLTGERLISENPPVSESIANEKIPAWIAKDGQDFTHQSIMTFSQTVDIGIIDAEGGGNTIPAYDTTGDFVGGKPFNGKTVGGNWEVYYTLNGILPDSRCNG